MLATMFDMGIPPAWNAAVMQIRHEQAVNEPTGLLANLERWQYQVGNALTTARISSPSRIGALGWTPAEALETSLRLRTFAEDWNAPGMEAYDALPSMHDRVAESFKPKTELGRRLLALRRAYVEKGGALLDAEALDRELQRRRGGVPDE